MNAYDIGQAARLLRVSPRTVRAMVATRELTPVPGTGGQGRRLLLDADQIHARASNDDLAKVFARAVLGLKAGKISANAAGYWKAWYDKAGKRVHHGLEYFDKPHGPTPSPKWISSNYLPDVWPQRHDELLKRCGRIARRLGRREMEYLIAACIVSAHPMAADCGQSIRAAQVSFDILRRKAAKQKLPALVVFWKHAPALVFARTPKERAIISDYELLNVLSRSPAYHPKAITAQVRRICSVLNVSPAMLRRDAEKRITFGLIRWTIPSAAAVGRIMDIQRAQAANLWRSIQRKLQDNDLSWLRELFAESTAARGVSARAILSLDARGGLL